MANLIKDFWIYTYKDKEYFGVCEVVGGDLKYRRINNKFETRIEKALSYMMEPQSKFVSHMSIQKYNTYLKDRPCRDEDEEAYYPYFIEIEPKEKNDYLPSFREQYQEAVGEALKTVIYLNQVMSVAEEDILIMINNSRSIYIMVNPKTYGLRPRKDLHLVYKEMTRILDEEIGLKYIDNLYKSYGLMKTPNCYYKGGYFVPISIQELKQLYNGQATKEQLTLKKRSLDYVIPGQQSSAMTKLYQQAIDNIKENKASGKRNKIYQGKETLERGKSVSKTLYYNGGQANCIKLIESGNGEKGIRNYALVSVAIYYKQQGYTQDQVTEKLVELAREWGHDETEAQVISKVKTVFRYNYNFSCEYAKQALGLDDEICKSCQYCKSNIKCDRKIRIQKDIIDDLWTNKASTRHYVTYLDLSKKQLFNRWFRPQEEGLSDRNIRELCKCSEKFIRSKNKELVYIENKASGNIYKLPFEFIENEVYIMLGESLKHYLKLVFMGYRSYDRYIVMRVSKDHIKDVLGYKDISSVHKLFKRLEDMGLAVIKKGMLVATYYESYKVVDIDHYIERKNRERVMSDSSYIPSSIVVNGICENAARGGRGSPEKT